MKAVLFDLDNTLIDFMKMKKIACEEAVDAMIDAGLDKPKEELLEKLYELYYEEGLEDQTIFQKFLKEINGDVDYKMLSYAIVAYRQARTGFLHPYPGTKQTLIKLKNKGLKLGIVTDAPKLKAWIRLVNMKLDDFFDVVIALADEGITKPAKSPFEKALKELKLKPEECLMVGDRPDKDIVGAKNMGIKTCFAKYGYDGEEKLNSDYEINNIKELTKIFK